MAIYAVKKGSESNERLVNRFKQQFQGSRLPKKLRSTERRTKPKNRRTMRITAMKREEYRKENTVKKFYSNM